MNHSFFWATIGLAFLIQPALTYAGSIKLSAQAVNLIQDDFEPSLVLTNQTDTPYVLHAEVTALDKSLSENLIVSPSIQKLNPGQHAAFRVLPRQGYERLKPNEVYERLVITSVAGRKKEEKSTANTRLMINVAYDLPVIYHGESIEQHPWKKIRFESRDGQNYIVNHSESIVRIKSVTDSSEHPIAPFTNTILKPLEARIIKHETDYVHLTPINYFGYVQDPTVLYLAMGQ